MRHIERSFSDLLRSPLEVTADLDRGDVLLRRRDEPDLWLSRAVREADRAEGFSSLSLVLRNLAVHQPKLLASELREAFPWIDFLPEPIRLAFAEEFTSAAGAAGSLDSFTSLSQLVREWRATAEIYADPELLTALTAPLKGDGARVAHPEA